jgi:hypothetical protein
MKRSICAIAILVLVSAASGTEIRFHVQAFGGAASSKYTTVPSLGISIEDYNLVISNRAGPAAGFGAGFTLPLLDSVYYQGTFEYIQKGTKVGWYLWDELIGYDVYTLGEFSHSSFIKLKPLRKLSPYALAGYFVSYILDHELRRGSAPAVPVDLTADTKRFDRGFVVGCGMEFEGNRLGAFVEYRHLPGHVDLSKGTGGLDNYPIIYTRTDAFLAGIRYRLGGKGT